ncbi:energy-coupling factor ABC transporter ATP-binding protein [Dolosigranulum pigrum]|uniref:energy-coupling factor ABC transporter ATP-binding protein n=1 Tax=Dolosigranulum pigrum TaxID=29394 RepID=UPI001AD86CB6|nr:energy-coupling factor ABC transporter ATP-binding protein [Dolosigranulum pigrum]
MDIRFQDVGYAYQIGSPFESRALYDVNLMIETGKYTALIGHTGSGKSTVLQHLNALKTPTEGIVQIGDRTITPDSENKKLKPLRKKVGIVFQFPEAQLFEETVGLDIAFGPRNFGMEKEEALAKAEALLEVVGLDASFMERSPFDLSGGQMRRVAIAGVLALEPEVLVLDEPTAGLDPRGQKEIMDMFYRLHKEQGLTIVLVTHQMDDVATYADHLIVLESGTVRRQGDPREIFAESDWLSSLQLGVPSATELANQLQAQYDWQFDYLPLTTEELVEQLATTLKKVGDHHDG